MRVIEQSRRFKRDYDLMKKRGKDMEKLKAAIRLLINKSPLPPSLKDHQLKCGYEGCRDCHIEPDWVLIYAVTAETLHLYRTGTHSDIFD